VRARGQLEVVVVAAEVVCDTRIKPVDVDLGTVRFHSQLKTAGRHAVWWWLKGRSCREIRNGGEHRLVGPREVDVAVPEDEVGMQSGSKRRTLYRAVRFDRPPRRSRAFRSRSHGRAARR
jgi:hypothetical protein